jgi:hypothetical protein
MTRAIPTVGRRGARVATIFAFTCFAVLTPACGVGGSDASDAGQGLLLLSFQQDSVDNAPLNIRLRFDFSEAVDASTISNASIQIREGPKFGANIFGLFIAEGSTVWFEPRLAGLCDHSDSGLKPDTKYRVQAIGFPEEFSIRNLAGQPLSATNSFEFHTRLDSDPNLYEDQIPGTGPSVIAGGVTPGNGTEAVQIAVDNEIILPISENLDPCTVNDKTVRLHMYESGDPTVFATAPNGRKSGFSDNGTDGGSTSDQTPNDPFTWGAGGAITTHPPQKILTKITLENTFTSTRIVVRPISGTFPENALIVLRVTFDVQDYGNQAMTPFSIFFTTENLPLQKSTYVVENEGETPWNDALSTADINTSRSPGKITAYMLFAGDGDNGGNQLQPTLPQVGPSCTTDRQVNDGQPDDFDPAADVLLDTGSTINTCTNSADGSVAVIWEFSSMTIRNGVTCRVVGANAAIFLVQGDVLIENGGTLKGRGSSIANNGQGETGGGYQGTNGAGVVDRQGGRGVAGGGNGGLSENADQAWRFGDDGNPGFGTPEFDASMPRKQVTNSGTPGQETGAGGAGQPAGSSTSNPWDGSGAGGGGGGHSSAGVDGDTNTGSVISLQLVTRSFGGGIWEGAYTSGQANSGGKMQRPEAGSGGGAGGFCNGRTYTTSTAYVGTGGAGGAGGGFIDVTSSGDIQIFGTLDVGGGRGGDGVAWNGDRHATGGGGGGSGGGGRMLTANDIILGPTSVVTAAGGAGGIGGAVPTNPTARNDGGAGGNGRIVFETDDGIVTGLGGATVIPGEGDDGFYRGPFDATRFKGGGLSPRAVSHVFAVGAFNPAYVTPIQSYGGQEDFLVGIPASATPGAGKTAILVQAQGFQMLADGSEDPTSGTGWFTVGHFVDSGVDSQPTWMAGSPSAAQLPSGAPSDTVGFGFANLNTCEFLQLRITLYLPPTVGPFDAGSFLDRWTICFTHNQ